MSPYNILSDIKSGRIQVKSMDSATILFFKCRRWDYIIPSDNWEQQHVRKYYPSIVHYIIPSDNWEQQHRYHSR